MTPIPDIGTTLDVPFVKILSSSNPLGWDSVHLHTFRLAHRGAPDPGYTPNDTLVLHLADPVRLKRRFEGQWNHGMSIPGNLSILPRDSVSTYEWSGPATCASFDLNPMMMASLINEISSVDPAHIEIKEKFNFSDPLIQNICRTLLQELQAGDGKPFAEMLGKTLAMHILRSYSTLPPVRELPEKKLTESQMSHLNDYIYDCLPDKITIETMAECVGFSSYYFARLFKLTTGITPHQYLIHWRVQHAKSLLLKTNLTISQVAEAAGFADQSHLTKQMKRLLGVTPHQMSKNSKNLPKLH